MIRLHHVPWSRSFRILWLLKEMGLECEIATYAITDGSLRAPEYLMISPAGRVPALEIDGKTLFESGAITEYLCETRPEHGFGRLPGDPERAKYVERLHFAETMASLIANLNLQWVFLRDPAMRSKTLLKIDTARLKISVQVIEDALEGQEYILPSGFSAVDTMLGFNLWATPYFVRLDDFPNVRAYIERVTARPGYRSAVAAEGPQSFYTQEFYDID